MNKKQKNIIFQWCAAAVLMILNFIFSDWILANWDWLRWATLPLIYVVAIFSRQQFSYRESSKNINRVVEKYPLLKLYLVTYCLLISMAVVATLVFDIQLISNLNYTSLMFLILLLVLPIAVIRSFEIYQKAGEESYQ